MERKAHVILCSNKPEQWKEIIEAWAQEGYEAEVVGGQQEPSSIAKAVTTGQVVVIDLSDALLQGLELVSACRRIAPQAPVVVVAQDLSVELERAIRAGGVFYVAVHPVEPREMCEVIANALMTIGRGRPTPSVVESKTRILVVDDDPDFVNAVTTLLESNGYAVSVARNGAEALQVLGSLRPDLVVLDIMMEDAWAGYAVNQALKWGEGYEWARSIPIVMVSALQEDPASRFAGASEVRMITPDAYLTKPLDTSKFLQTVKNLVEKHRARRRSG